MESVLKILHAYGLGSKQSESHKQKYNPSERRINQIKETTITILDSSGAPSWSCILSMAYVVSILSWMSHLSLSWSTLHEAAYDLVHPKMSPTLSLSGMYQNRLFIVGIGPIINK